MFFFLLYLNGHVNNIKVLYWLDTCHPQDIFFSFSFLIYSFCIKVFYICIIYFLTPPSFNWKSECFSFYKALVWVKNDFSQTRNKLEIYAQVLNSIHFVLRTSKLIGKNLHIYVLLDMTLFSFTYEFGEKIVETWYLGLK